MASELFKLVGTIAIDATDATQKIEAVIEAGEGLEAALKNIGTNADGNIGSKSGFNVAAVWMGNMLTTLTAKATELGSAIWKAGYSFTTDLESWTMTFKTYMDGDMEAAQAFVEELRQFAYDTPLSISDVMSSAAKLMASGVDHDEVIDTMWMLGDLANGNTELMSRIAYAYGQIVTAGKMQGNDPRQLKEAFVPIYKMLEEYYQAEGLNYDLSSLMELQAAGEITADDVYNAFKKATGPEGQWYNAMNNQMETTAGKMEKLEDAYTMASASLIQSFTEIMKAETLDKLTATFDKFITWAAENPDVLDSLAQALSNLATTGLDVLLGSLQSLLTFWDTNKDLFNGMLMLLGGVAIKSGQFGAGAALITAGGYNIWDDWVKETKKAFSGLTSDVDLPFIRQQLEYQGKEDQWEAYLENWKNARKNEGYSDEDITGYIDSQFENYIPYTNAQMDATYGGYQGSEAYKNGGMSALDSFVEKMKILFFGNDGGSTVNENGHGGRGLKWGLPEGVDADGIGGSLKQLNENMRNHNMLFASLGGMPDRKSEETGGTFTWISDTLRDFANGRQTGRFDASTLDFDGSGSTSIPALIASVQTLAGEVQSLTGSIPDAIASGISGISVTGTITTGNVVLNTGALVGQLTPRLNLSLGTAAKRATRG
jgi:tape measure domain-containing protein